MEGKMKKIFRKYSEMDNVSKEDLRLLYVYHVLSEICKKYRRSIGGNEKEKIMRLILNCLDTTNLSVEYVITSILEIVNCQAITIEDLENLETNELVDILFNVDSKPKEKVMLEFMNRGYHCIFLRNRERYFLILTKDSYTDVLTFKNFEEILNNSIEQFLLEKKLYG